MKNNYYNLITIGELSKLSGVNAKSLRYYEEIGVLKPAYIDPNNAYRYYTYSQMSRVSSIQFYVQMDIPLSELLKFEKGSSINYREQINYGIDLAKQKKQTIEKQIRYAEFLISELERSERILNADSPVRNMLPAKNCLTVPVQGELTERKYYSSLKRLLLEIKEAKINKGSENGILCLNKNGLRQCYVYVDVEASNGEQVIQIPAQNYLSIKSPFVDISKKEFEGEITILSELFVSDFDYRNRIFELRWSE